MMRLVVLAMCLTLVVDAGADVISFQDPATGDGGYSSQVFEEEYWYAHIYQLDDLDLGPHGYYLESAVLYWVVGIVEPEYYRLRTYSDRPTSGWDTDQYFLKEYSGVSDQYDQEGRWAVTFDLGGDAYGGIIWIAAYVRADFDEHGIDQWYNANAENLGYQPNGSEEYVWEWGLGWSPPYRGQQAHGQTADMSWKFEGTPIPEPAATTLFAAAALAARYLLRRRA